MAQGAVCGLFVLMMLARAQSDAQTNDARYSLRLSVDEVRLSFHAADAQGRPVLDLKASELRLLDNGMPPGRVLVFDSGQDLPIRAGILVDMSQSMHEARPRDRAIASRFVERLLRRPMDQGFVMRFDRFSRAC
jgi:Ca-activated chloride channel homolog